MNYSGDLLSEIKTVPPVHDAVMRVKELREKSSRAGTRKQAEFPTLFGEIRHPDGPIPNPQSPEKILFKF